MTITAIRNPAGVPSAYEHEVNYSPWADRVMVGTTAFPNGGSLVSSRVVNTNLHTIAIDLDMHASLVPSSTEGHYHLYIDRLLTWRRYKRLLRALMRAGVIEKGYYRASVARRATHLRLPGVKK